MDTKTIVGALAGGSTSPAPTIECWMPEREANGIGLIIFPGGGYAIHAEHEGKGYAEHFARFGITCFVVRYRLGSGGNRHPAIGGGHRRAS